MQMVLWPLNRPHPLSVQVAVYYSKPQGWVSGGPRNTHGREGSRGKVSIAALRLEFWEKKQTDMIWCVTGRKLRQEKTG